MPKVSILMTAFNAADFIEGALESILNQTYRNWECIVVDDGSEDQTFDIIANFSGKDDRFAPIQNTHSGQTKSLNLGLQQARGQYIARLDADDLMHRRRIELQVDFLENNKRIGLLGSYVELIDEQGEPFSIIKPPTRDEDLRKLLISRNPFVHSSVVFPVEALARVGGYDPSFTSAQDYDLWLRIAQAYDLAIYPELLTSIRKHRQSISYTKRRDQSKCHMRAQLGAIRRGQYPKFAILRLLRPLVYYLLPEKLFRYWLNRRTSVQKRFKVVQY